MIIFNKGDKVKRISGSHFGMKVGDTAIVVSQSNPGCGVSLKGLGIGHTPRNLVKIPNTWRAKYEKK